MPKRYSGTLYTTPIIQKLTTYRRAKGFTQRIVAEALNISPTTINGWETSRTSPTFENILLYAQLLGYEFRLCAYSTPPKSTVIPCPSGTKSNFTTDLIVQLPTTSSPPPTRNSTK